MGGRLAGAHRHRGRRRRRAGQLEASCQVPGPQPRLAGARGHALPRHSALPGEPPGPAPEHAGRDLADPRDRPRRTQGAGEWRPRGDRSRAAFGLRRHDLRSGKHRGGATPREVAEARPRERLLRLRLGRARVRAPDTRRGRPDGRDPDLARAGLPRRSDPDGASRGRRRLDGHRPGRDRAPALGLRGDADALRPARIHPRQPRRARDPARLARLRALVDPRRFAHVLGSAPHGTCRGGARVHRVVRGTPVRERQSPMLRRQARRRPGARARQPRRVHLSRGRGPSSDRRP